MEDALDMLAIAHSEAGNVLERLILVSVVALDIFGERRGSEDTLRERDLRLSGGLRLVRGVRLHVLAEEVHTCQLAGLNQSVLAVLTRDHQAVDE